MRLTPVRLQANEMDCGPTCLGSILEFYNDYRSNIELRRLCSASREPASVAQIKSAAETLGYQCTIRKVGVKSLAKFSRPVILHWDMTHYVVLDGILGNSVRINDPAHGRRKLSLNELKRHYTGICIDLKLKEKRGGQTRPPFWRKLRSLRPAGTQALDKMSFLVSALAAVLLFALEVTFGGLLSVFYDYVMEFRIQTWGYILVALGIPVILLRSLVSHLQKCHTQNRVDQVNMFMIRGFLDRFLEKPINYFEAHHAGELGNRVRDLERVLSYSSTTLLDLSRVAIFLVASGIALWSLSPLLVTVHFVPRILLITWTFATLNYDQELEIREGVVATQNEALVAQRAKAFIRYYAAGQQRHLLMSSLFSQAKLQSIKVQKARSQAGIMALRRTLQVTAFPVSVFTGACLMIQTSLTYGGFIFSMVLILLFQTELERLTDIAWQYMRIKPVCGRIAEALEASTEVSKALTTMQATLKPTTPIYKVDNLSFTYQSQQIPLFSKVSFEISAGECVNIAGQSGAGKSTLLDVLAGIRQPSGGQVYYSGQPLEGFAPVGYVCASDHGVSGSLIKFLTNGRPVELDRVRKVIHISQMLHKVGFLIESRSSENLEELGLSRGETQRLFLARSLYRSLDCILFDDAMDHLSLLESQKIIHALRKEHTTVIMATHRLDVQALCDRTILIGG